MQPIFEYRYLRTKALCEVMDLFKTNYMKFVRNSRKLEYCHDLPILHVRQLCRNWKSNFPTFLFNSPIHYAICYCLQGFQYFTKPRMLCHSNNFSSSSLNLCSDRSVIYQTIFLIFSFDCFWMNLIFMWTVCKYKTSDRNVILTNYSGYANSDLLNHFLRSVVIIVGRQCSENQIETRNKLLRDTPERNGVTHGCSENDVGWDRCESVLYSS